MPMQLSFFRICVSCILSSYVHNKTRMLPQDIYLANMVAVRFFKAYTSSGDMYLLQQPYFMNITGDVGVNPVITGFFNQTPRMHI